jgi:RNA polymerase sigma-70 factor, ECF subfamily
VTWGAVVEAVPEVEAVVHRVRDGAALRDGSQANAQSFDEAGALIRVQRGEVAAFDAVVRAHMRRAYGLAYRILGRREDAEDLVQEAFMIALDHIASFDTTRPFAPWLMRIVATRALNARKSIARRRTETLIEETVAPGLTPDVETEASEVRAKVQHALATLPERQRLILQLFELDGYSAQEIAEMLGISAGTVRWHAHEARQAMRVALGSVYAELRANEMDGEDA